MIVQAVQAVGANPLKSFMQALLQAVQAVGANPLKERRFSECRHCPPILRIGGWRQMARHPLSLREAVR
jgi:hypothetical protein